jgi:ERCC4-related helicase
LTHLTHLVQGKIIMPVIFEDDLNSIINRPSICFIETKLNPYEKDLLALIDGFIQPFIKKLNSFFSLKLESKSHVVNAFKNLLNNICDESHVSVNNSKRYLAANFLRKIINSLEILSILGISLAIDYILECLKNEEINKQKIWNPKEIEEIKNFYNQLSNSHFLSQKPSEKVQKLQWLLEQTSSIDNQNETRCIVFVRKRKTARLLVDYLNKQINIKEFWRPELFVGHAQNGVDGMNWSEQQEPTLNKFLIFF